MIKLLSGNIFTNSVTHYKRFHHNSFPVLSRGLLTGIVFLILNQYSPTILASKSPVSAIPEGESLVLRCWWKGESTLYKH